MASYSYDVTRPAAETVRESSASRRDRLSARMKATKRSRVKTWLLFGSSFALLSMVGLLVWFFVIRPIGFGTSLVAATAALVPFSFVMIAVWWLDRYTPQPRMTLIYAFAWGAIGSVSLSLVFGFAAELLIALNANSPTAQQFLTLALQAPLIEEGTKALGLVLLLLFGRRYISGPIDGVIYAVLIAAGFAFTENILYFSRAFAASQAAGNTSMFWETFLMRGLMSPFAHASFTSLVGLGIGIAAERRSLLLYLLLGFGGLGLGMSLHALWNGGSMLIQMHAKEGLKDLLFWYVVVEVPIFVTLGLVLIGLRLRERSIVRARLAEYARAGWFTPDEVGMLVRLGNRRQAIRWAAAHGAVAAWAMRDFHNAALRLAAHRQAALSGHTSTRIQGTEAQLLDELVEARRAVNALTLPVGPRPQLA